MSDPLDWKSAKMQRTAEEAVRARMGVAQTNELPKSSFGGTLAGDDILGGPFSGLQSGQDRAAKQLESLSDIKRTSSHVAGADANSIPPDAQRNIEREIHKFQRETIPGVAWTEDADNYRREKVESDPITKAGREGVVEYVHGAGDAFDAVSAPLLYAGRKLGKGLTVLTGGSIPTQEKTDEELFASDMGGWLGRISSRQKGDYSEKPNERVGLTGQVLRESLESGSIVSDPDASFTQKARGVIGAGAGLLSTLASGGVPARYNPGKWLASRVDDANIARFIEGKPLIPNPSVQDFLSKPMPKFSGPGLGYDRRGGLFIKNKDFEAESTEHFIEEASKQIAKRFKKLHSQGLADNYSDDTANFLESFEREDLAAALRDPESNPEAFAAISEVYKASSKKIQRELSQAGSKEGADSLAQGDAADTGSVRGAEVLDEEALDAAADAILKGAPPEAQQLTPSLLPVKVGKPKKGKISAAEKAEIESNIAKRVQEAEEIPPAELGEVKTPDLFEDPLMQMTKRDEFEIAEAEVGLKRRTGEGKRPSLRSLDPTELTEEERILLAAENEAAYEARIKAHQERVKPLLKKQSRKEKALEEAEFEENVKDFGVMPDDVREYDNLFYSSGSKAGELKEGFTENFADEVGKAARPYRESAPKQLEEPTTTPDVTLNVTDSGRAAAPREAPEILGLDIGPINVGPRRRLDAASDVKGAAPTQRKASIPKKAFDLLSQEEKDAIINHGVDTAADMYRAIKKANPKFSDNQAMRSLASELGAAGKRPAERLAPAVDAGKESAESTAQVLPLPKGEGVAPVPGRADAAPSIPADVPPPKVAGPAAPPKPPKEPKPAPLMRRAMQGPINKPVQGPEYRPMQGPSIGDPQGPFLQHESPIGPVDKPIQGTAKIPPRFRRRMAVNQYNAAGPLDAQANASTSGTFVARSPSIGDTLGTGGIRPPKKAKPQPQLPGTFIGQADRAGTGEITGYGSKADPFAVDPKVAHLYAKGDAGSMAYHIDETHTPIKSQDTGQILSSFTDDARPLSSLHGGIVDNVINQIWTGGGKIDWDSVTGAAKEVPPVAKELPPVDLANNAMKIGAKRFADNRFIMYKKGSVGRHILNTDTIFERFLTTISGTDTPAGREIWARVSNILPESQKVLSEVLPDLMDKTQKLVGAGAFRSSAIRAAKKGQFIRDASGRIVHDLADMEFSTLNAIMDDAVGSMFPGLNTKRLPKNLVDFAQSFKNAMFRVSQFFEEAGGITKTKDGYKPWVAVEDAGRFLRRHNQDFARMVASGNPVGEAYIKAILKLPANQGLTEQDIVDYFEQIVKSFDSPQAFEFTRKIPAEPDWFWYSMPGSRTKTRYQVNDMIDHAIPTHGSRGTSAASIIRDQALRAAHIKNLGHTNNKDVLANDVLFGEGGLVSRMRDELGSQPVPGQYARKRLGIDEAPSERAVRAEAELNRLLAGTSGNRDMAGYATKTSLSPPGQLESAGKEIIRMLSDLVASFAPIKSIPQTFTIAASYPGNILEQGVELMTIAADAGRRLLGNALNKTQILKPVGRMIARDARLVAADYGLPADDFVNSAISLLRRPDDAWTQKSLAKIVQSADVLTSPFRLSAEIFKQAWDATALAAGARQAAKLIKMARKGGGKTWLQDLTNRGISSESIEWLSNLKGRKPTAEEIKRFTIEMATNTAQMTQKALASPAQNTAFLNDTKWRELFKFLNYAITTMRTGEDFHKRVRSVWDLDLDTAAHMGIATNGVDLAKYKAKAIGNEVSKLAMYLGASVVGGDITRRVTNAVFEQEETDQEKDGLKGRALANLGAMGTFGLWGNIADYFHEINGLERPWATRDGKTMKAYGPSDFVFTVKAIDKIARPIARALGQPLEELGITEPVREREGAVDQAVKVATQSGWPRLLRPEEEQPKGKSGTLDDLLGRGSAGRSGTLDQLLGGRSSGRSGTLDQLLGGSNSSGASPDLRAPNSRRSGTLEELIGAGR
jgi:hypothetical protein